MTYGYAVDTSDVDFEAQARDTINRLVEEVVRVDTPLQVTTNGIMCAATGQGGEPTPGEYPTQFSSVRLLSL